MTCRHTILLVLLLPLLARAGDPGGGPSGDVAGDAGGESAEPAWKLTVGRYALQGAPDGTDVNLRWRRDGRTLWLGAYRDAAFGSQARAGWDDQWALGTPAPGWPLQLLPSLQVATRGFVGGSLALQAGEPVYVQLGIGRTNLRPYANLNFDPNDAINAAVGWQGDGGRQLQLSLTADDRLHTQQKHWHLNGRWPIGGDFRLTLDLLRKTGLGDSGEVRAWGWSATLDAPRWFVRLARDPKQNFSAFDAWRLSAGRRF